ncbi:hypothetical protein K435DRAFT_856189 [Dendrothele bispora CBS 962.96]|uniref:Uncharacterized protein n=1 Tax=Dendrothele bispora (strain CBS 962.96) TaxID=1314807 RepID=A0A4S8M901_DENBC|nr:hypothetical protein K435DRAFT_856189 [Dendrothele bispora CBS 962.96]
MPGVLRATRPYPYRVPVAGSSSSSSSQAAGPATTAVNSKKSFSATSMSFLTVRNIPVTRFHCDFRLTNAVVSSDFALQYKLEHTDLVPLTITREPLPSRLKPLSVKQAKVKGYTSNCFRN